MFWSAASIAAFSFSFLAPLTAQKPKCQSGDPRRTPGLQAVASGAVMSEAPSVEQLETFPNPRPGRDYTIEIVCPEFTSLCPKTGQPDFGIITFLYTPAATCVELKSLKLYLQRYRDVGVFYEAVVNRLLDDFVSACRPVRCQVTGAFTPRGGITTTIICCHEASEGP
jgi:7-cyano-7-deazaguanine reductase